MTLRIVMISIALYFIGRGLWLIFDKETKVQTVHYPESNPLLVELKQLQDLKENGILTETEFQTAKQKVIRR